MADIGGIASERLQSFIERIERLTDEVKAINADKSDLFKEAKAVGFDTNAMKQIIKLRALGKEDRQEQEHLLDLYKAALGMD